MLTLSQCLIILNYLWRMKFMTFFKTITEKNLNFRIQGGWMALLSPYTFFNDVTCPEIFIVLLYFYICINHCLFLSGGSCLKLIPPYYNLNIVGKKKIYLFYYYYFWYQNLNPLQNMWGSEEKHLAKRISKYVFDVSGR